MHHDVYVYVAVAVQLAQYIRNLGTTWREASGQCHVPVPSPSLERDPINPLDKRFGGHHGQPGGE